MKKDIKNVDVISCKLELALTRAITNKLKIARKKTQKMKK